MATTGVLWASGTPSTTGTTWTSATAATGANNAAFATWSSTTSGASGSITTSLYGAQTAIGSQPASVDSVAVTVYNYLSANVSRMASITVQLTDNGTPFGTPQNLTETTTSTNSETLTFTGVTWAQLQFLGVRITWTRSAVTTACNGLVDAVGVDVTYTPNVTNYNGGASRTGTGTITAAGTSAVPFYATASVAGTGTLASAGTVGKVATAAVAGTGTVTTAGTAYNPAAVGITEAVANGWLASFATPYVALHVGEPGAAGTANPSAGSTTRLLATMGAASGGVRSMSTPTSQWTNGGTNEVLTHISLWTAASGGSHLGSVALPTSAQWSTGGKYRLTSLSIGLPIIVTAGGQPSAPLNVTSITRDASADVSWYAPTSSGDSAITHYIITPYDGATPLTATTVTVASTTAVTDSYGTTARKASVSGLTNGTAYTFKVAARNTQGDGPQSDASGANTPFAGLVFGDDFNGPANGRPDPEWWVYDRCGYLAQNEVQFYKQTHCVLDGSGRLKITAEHVNASGPRYPSDPSYPGTITQPWTSGACQSNTRLFYPAAGHSMTFEGRFQINPHAGSGYWPGFFWLEGQDYIQAWKTDPLQQGWNDTGRAEIDIAEWMETGSPNSYGNVSWAGTNEGPTGCLGDGTLHSQMHTYSCIWTPGVSVVFKRDGTTTATHTGQVPASGAQFFLMIYMQMVAGGVSDTESAYVDYIRVYEN